MTRRRIALLSAVLALALVAEPDPVAWMGGRFVESAGAVVGRPVTPISYAGVARRTTRRVVRRTTVYVNTLPAACVSVTVNGAGYWQCGATYYAPYGGRYVVVVID